MSWGAACVAAFAVTGCGAGYEVAPVRGKVTCEGKPVPGGMIIFTPISDGDDTEMPAPPATAQVDEEGNFELMTDGEPGAMVGKHRVTFSVPDADPGEMEEDVMSADDDDEEARAEEEAELELAKRLAKVPCRRLAENEITVSSGENNIEIKLALGSNDDDEED